MYATAAERFFVYSHSPWYTVRFRGFAGRLCSAWPLQEVRRCNSNRIENLIATNRGCFSTWATIAARRGRAARAAAAYRYTYPHTAYAPRRADAAAGMQACTALRGAAAAAGARGGGGARERPTASASTISAVGVRVERCCILEMVTSMHSCNIKLPT